MNRYCSNAYGRFMTPDPYQSNVGGAGNPEDPGNWNKYAYTRGDPVNRYDPYGLQDCGGDDEPPCIGPPIIFPGGGTPTGGGQVPGKEHGPNPNPPCTSQYSASTLNFIQTNYAAAQAIANAGFDPVGTSTNAGYGTRVANTNAAGRINCLQKMGALQ